MGLLVWFAIYQVISMQNVEMKRNKLCKHNNDPNFVMHFSLSHFPLLPPLFSELEDPVLRELSPLWLVLDSNIEMRD